MWPHTQHSNIDNNRHNMKNPDSIYRHNHIQNETIFIMIGITSTTLIVSIDIATYRTLTESIDILYNIIECMETINESRTLYAIVGHVMRRETMENIMMTEKVRGRTKRNNTGRFKAVAWSNIDINNPYHRGPRSVENHGCLCHLAGH